MAATNAAVAGAIAREEKRKLVGGCAGAMCAKAPVGGTLAAGALVFDPETGETGRVIASGTTTVIVQDSQRPD